MTESTVCSRVLNPSARKSIDVLRHFLDDVAYASAWQQHFPQIERLRFPSRSDFDHAAGKFQPPYNILFRLMCAGESAPLESAHRLFSGPVVDAFLDTGVLVETAGKRIQTPGVALISTGHGLNLVVSLPSHFADAQSRRPTVYIGPDSLWLASAIPVSLQGRHVLDVCAGSGVQGLICASRGATSVVALENNRIAVETANFNAVLNGFGECYEARESDIYSALRPGERFDFIVSNPPFMPAVRDVGYPMFADGGADGTVLLRRIISEMPGWLATPGEARLVAVLLGTTDGPNFTKNVLKSLADQVTWQIRTWVHRKVPFRDYVHEEVPRWLGWMRSDLSDDEREARISTWLADLREAGIATDYLYAQTMRLRTGQRDERVHCERQEVARPQC